MPNAELNTFIIDGKDGEIAEWETEDNGLLQRWEIASVVVSYRGALEEAAEVRIESNGDLLWSTWISPEQPSPIEVPIPEGLQSRAPISDHDADAGKDVIRDGTGGLRITLGAGPDKVAGRIAVALSLGSY